MDVFFVVEIAESEGVGGFEAKNFCEEEEYLEYCWGKGRIFFFFS